MENSRFSLRICHTGRMGNRRWISVAILAVSIPVYACLCWPAIGRRGFPEIDPFWLAMPWLWIVPIVLSGLFDGASRSRKWSVGVYTLLSAFFFAGTVIWMVPNPKGIMWMLLTTIFPCVPVNLLIAFTVEKVCQRLLRPFRIWGNTTPNDATTMHLVRAVALIVVILGLAVSFPFAYQTVTFHAARSSARADAERDWSSGQAIWFVQRGDPEAFGASEGCYSVANGLKTERVRSGVAAAAYCDAYRAVVARKLAQFGPTDKIKDLCMEAELQAWIKEGRFQRAESFPLKQGTAEISLKGYNISGFNNNSACLRGEPSKFLYYTIVPEKKNALVAITDNSIWIFAKTGELLQSIDFETYRQMRINEDVLSSREAN